jgi:hypothetical protein
MTGFPHLRLVMREPEPRRRYETRIVVSSARTPIGRTRTFRLTESDYRASDRRGHANGGTPMSDAIQMSDEILFGILLAAENSERKLFKGLPGLVKQLAQRNAPDGGDAP